MKKLWSSHRPSLFGSAGVWFESKEEFLYKEILHVSLDKKKKKLSTAVGLYGRVNPMSNSEDSML